MLLRRSLDHDVKTHRELPLMRNPSGMAAGSKIIKVLFTTLQNFPNDPHLYFLRPLR